MLGLPEILRLLHNVIRLGTIAEVDANAARCRVRVGSLLTGWLPWLAGHAGATTQWSLPSVDEQVVLLSPGGDLAAGIALCGLYQSAFPAPAAESAVWLQRFPDGAEVEYNHSSSHLRATLPGSAEITAAGNIVMTSPQQVTISAAGGLTLDADTTVSGSLAINGESVTHGAKNIGKDHLHTGVQTGPGLSGGPA